MKFSNLALLGLVVSVAHGFAPSPPACNTCTVMTTCLKLSAREEETAMAMSDLMAKSHEEKLRAIKDVEAKKNAEINALKAELAKLKEGSSSSSSSSSIVTSPPPASIPGSKEELAEKLIAYQRFMSKYIVEAQEQKLQAVRDAEAAITKRFEEQGNLLSSAPVPLAKAPPPAPESAESKLYKERNAKVAAAAKAGKSRWGDKEVQRVSTMPSSTPPTVVQNIGASVVQQVNGVNGSAATKSANIPVPPEVEAADHGLRADGGVGGLTLAERVALGAESSTFGGGINGEAVNGEILIVNGAPVAPAVTTSTTRSLYQKRNAAVAKSGKASRWGEMEVQRAIKLASEAPPTPTIVSSPEIEAADHGLRSSGGVGGPSLAERVNLGAKLLGR